MQTGTDRMTRRQLGKLAAAGSAAFLPAARATAQNNAQNSAQNKYGGPLEGLEDKVDAASFDPVLYTRKLYESAPLRLTFRAQNRKQAEAWQKRLRAKLTELVGGFPAQRAALQPQTLETRDFPAYCREKFVFGILLGMRRPARSPLFRSSAPPR